MCRDCKPPLRSSPSIRRQLISDAFSLEERSGRAGKIYPRCNQGPGKAASAHKSAAGQSLPIHSAPVPTNVRYASNSDHSRHESELAQCATTGHFRGHSLNVQYRCNLKRRRMPFPLRRCHWALRWWINQSSRSFWVPFLLRHDFA